jgi:N-acetylmuramoyl-L-alanine amidase
MKKLKIKFFVLLYCGVFIGAVSLCQLASSSVTVLKESEPVQNRTVIIIDAGHGGIDGGATSCTGIPESHINLQISLRLNDLVQLLGFETKMIRKTDTSVYTEGNTIAAQKVSDLKQRVKLVNETRNAVLVSVHQNTFLDSRYSGAQVFYANDDTSRELAKVMQADLISNLNPGSKRQCKSSDGIDLMQNIQRPGVLIECGFLSNPEEEANLQTAEYQKHIASVVATCISRFYSC